MTRNHVLSLVCSPLLALALLVPAASAQRTPTPPDTPQDRRGGGPDSHGGMGIVPPGTWWKNPEIVTALSLTQDQQKRLDEILQQSRLQLIDMHASLEKEQVNLEPLLNANPPDQGRALAEISKIADLRASLEKANAKMLLGLRGVLTADQWTKLQAQRHPGGRRGGGDGPDGQDRGQGRGQGRGRSGPGGPGGGGNVGNPPMPPAPPSED